MTKPIKWNGEEKNLDLPFCHPIKFFDVSTCFHLLNPGTDFLHHKRSDQCHQIFPHYLPCRKVGWVARLTRLHHSQILLYQCVPYMQSHKRLHRNHQRRRSSSFLPLEFLNKTASTKLVTMGRLQKYPSLQQCGHSQRKLIVETKKTALSTWYCDVCPFKWNVCSSGSWPYHQEEDKRNHQGFEVDLGSFMTFQEILQCCESRTMFLMCCCHMCHLVIQALQSKKKQKFQCSVD